MNNSSGIAALILLGLGAYVLSSRVANASNSPSFSPNAENPASDENFPWLNWLGQSEPLYNDSAPTDSDYAAEYVAEDFDNTAYTYTVEDQMGIARDWKINEYPKYASAIQTAEDSNGIPRDLFARQLAKETGSFRLDIITGIKRSPVGAMGIAQFMPATGIQYGLIAGNGPGSRGDPFASIAAGARYMRDLYRQFGSWRYALAAYNWGPGNVAKWLRGDLRQDGTPWSPPAETRDYLASITADVPVA